jgi:hypothetical protein
MVQSSERYLIEVAAIDRYRYYGCNCGRYRRYLLPWSCHAEVGLRGVRGGDEKCREEKRTTGFLHGGRKEIFTVTVLKNEWLRFTCADMA